MEFKPVEKLTSEEIKEEMIQLNRTIRVLQWDKSKDQINPAKLFHLEQLQKRLSELTSKLSEE